MFKLHSGPIFGPNWPKLAQIGPIFWFDRYRLQIDTNQEFLQTINKFWIKKWKLY